MDLGHLIDLFLHGTICVVAVMLMGILQPGKGKPQEEESLTRCQKSAFVLATELPLVTTYIPRLIFKNWELGAGGVDVMD